MKTKDEIENIYRFINYFNDGRFMNQDYRAGILDALSFVLYQNTKLERTLKDIKEILN